MALTAERLCEICGISRSLLNRLSRKMPPGCFGERVGNTRIFTEEAVRWLLQRNMKTGRPKGYRVPERKINV